MNNNCLPLNEVKRERMYFEGKYEYLKVECSTYERINILK